MTRALLTLALALAGCGTSSAAPEGPRTAAGFPQADRPVSAVVSSRWSNEPDRDLQGEAGAVMKAAGIRPGMAVADIGAGEGYYTIRLSKEIGPRGHVIAEDIMPEYRDRLAERIAREKIGNVSVTLGKPADPGLAAASADRIFLIHMYHEISEPYEMLWRMRPALRPGGLVVVVDADRPTQSHGTPPKLLDCEFASAGYALRSRKTMPEAGGYLALYEAKGARPEPGAMRSCKP